MYMYMFSTLEVHGFSKFLVVEESHVRIRDTISRSNVLKLITLISN